MKGTLVITAQVGSLHMYTQPCTKHSHALLILHKQNRHNMKRSCILNGFFLSPLVKGRYKTTLKIQC